MAIRSVTAAAVALGFVCPAYADTRISVRGERELPTLALGAPTRATLEGADVTIDREHGRALLAVTLSSREHNDDLRSCLADEVVTWHFSAGDYTTRVNYPLDFRVAP